MALTYIHLDSMDKKLYRVHKTLLKARTDEEVCLMAHNLGQIEMDSFRALRVAVNGTMRERKIKP